MTFLRRFLWVLTAGYWALIFVLTHIPPDKLPHTHTSDKLQHFLAYMGLSFLLGATFSLAVPRLRRILPLLVLLVPAVYGVFDEVTQIPVGRTCDVHDWIADASGAAVAAGLLFLFQKVLPRRTGQGPPGSGDAALAVDAR